MRTINDVETYEDDYGNTKQLSVVDHSPKSIFSLSDIVNKHEQEARKIDDFLKLRDRKDFIKSISSYQLHCLLNLYDHLINYDTDIDCFQWDENKLEDLLLDNQAIDFLETLIKENEITMQINKQVIIVRTQQNPKPIITSDTNL